MNDNYDHQCHKQYRQTRQSSVETGRAGGCRQNAQEHAGNQMHAPEQTHTHTCAYVHAHTTHQPARTHTQPITEQHNDLSGQDAHHFIQSFKKKKKKKKKHTQNFMHACIQYATVLCFRGRSDSLYSLEQLFLNFIGHDCTFVGPFKRG